MLNYLLAYEELQARFYAHAVQSGKLASPWREFANVVKGHEDAHVAFLRQRLGGAARPSPAFQLGVEATNLAAFPHVAVTLEDAGVALYNGQAANLTASSLAAVATIMSVESRHAAWVRALAGEIPAPLAVDPADSQSQVQSQVAAVGVRTS